MGKVRKFAIERFPEHEARIGELANTDAEFNRLCMDYDALSERIAEDEKTQKSPSDTDAALRERRREMEDSMLRMIRGGLRV